MRKLGAGQSLPTIPRQTYNAFIDAAVFAQEQQRGLNANVTEVVRNSTIVMARNTSGADRKAGHAVSLDTARITPGESDISPALSQPILQVGTASSGSRCGVCLEPIPEGKFGKVVVAGLAWMRVTGTGVFVTVSGSVGTLGSDGDFAVIWAADDDEGDPADSEGERWALALLRGGGGTGSTSGCLKQTVSGGQDANSYTVEGIWGTESLTRTGGTGNFESANIVETYTVSGVSKTSTYKYVLDIDDTAVPGSSVAYYASLTLTHVSGDDPLSWSAMSVTGFRDKWQGYWSRDANPILPDGVTVPTLLLGEPGT